MKKFVTSLFLVFILTAFTFTQDYSNAGMDYTKALYENKTVSARINALKKYIATYTDTSNKFVKLAYYQLAINYFENKDYAKAIKIGEQTFTLGSLGSGEEARLNLVLANSYGIKSYSGFNKSTALKYITKAISLAKEVNDKNVIATAQKLKKSLSGPPPRKMTPEQKIKTNYSDGEYRKAIGYYNSLGETDKNNKEIKKIYAYSLFKEKKYDTALSTFLALYKNDSKGLFPKYIGDIYSEKAKRNKKYHDLAATFYLEASILYKKEGSSANQKIAAGKAKVEIENKYGYKAKYNKYKAEIKKKKSSSQRNEKAIRDAKRALRKFKRYMRKTYRDVQAPQYEYDKLTKLEDKVNTLSSSSSSSTGSSLGKNLLELRKKIDNEYSSLLLKTEKKIKDK